MANPLMKPDGKQLSGCGVGAIIFGGIMTFIVVAAIFGEDSPKEPKTEAELPALSKEELRKQRIEKLFSSWDGSFRPLEQIIKNSMNNPDSYKHVETRYGDFNDYLLVATTFRGTNSFNAIVTQTVKAKVDTLGNIIQIIE